MSSTYRICERCVMDTSDPEIQFDDDGICNHCRKMVQLLSTIVNPDPNLLQMTVETIRREGRSKRYDCILGISGGVDSTYAAYLVKRLGLRPLAVHLDNGWDSELAVKNIENILNLLGIDLYTHVLDWDEFRDLQLAFLRAGTPDCEIPTDHAIWAVLYQVAKREGVRHIISGMNIRTEGILPSTWTYGAYDWRYIRSVHAKHGTVPLRSFPRFTLTDRFMNYLVRRLRVFRVLDHIDYRKQDAMAVIQKELGWRDYGGKHGESIYTRFYQAYILPTKFSIDKRRAHLSALIVSGQTSREKALSEILQAPYSQQVLMEDREYTIRKLGLSAVEFEKIMVATPRSHRDFHSHESLLRNISTCIRIGRRWGVLRPTSGL